MSITLANRRNSTTGRTRLDFIYLQHRPDHNRNPEKRRNSISFSCDIQR
jgi:hypothetical protein